MLAQPFHYGRHLVTGFGVDDQKSDMWIRIQGRENQEKPRTAGAYIGNGAGNFRIFFGVGQPRTDLLNRLIGGLDAMPRRLP
jgi:hypothetical protein